MEMEKEAQRHKGTQGSPGTAGKWQLCTHQPSFEGFAEVWVGKFLRSLWRGLEAEMQLHRFSVSPARRQLAAAAQSTAEPCNPSSFPNTAQEAISDSGLPQGLGMTSP